MAHSGSAVACSFCRVRACRTGTYMYIYTYMPSALCHWRPTTIPIQSPFGHVMKRRFFGRRNYFKWLQCRFASGLLVLGCGTESCNRLANGRRMRSAAAYQIQHPNIPTAQRFKLSKMFGTRPHSQQEKHADSAALDRAVMRIISCLNCAINLCNASATTLSPPCINSIRHVCLCRAGRCSTCSLVGW